MRKLVTATVSAAFCFMSVAPAAAQQYRSEGFDGPRGANATLNLRIPLGKAARAKPTYGLTFGMGKTMGAGFDGRPITRQVTVGDIRFNQRGELNRAQLASFDLAHLGADRRMNLTGGLNTTWFILGAVAAGVGICLLTDCLGEGDDDAVPNN